MMSSPYSKTHVFFPISWRPPNGITLKQGDLVFAVGKELFELIDLELVVMEKSMKS